MFVLIPLTQHSTGIPVSTIRIQKKKYKKHNFGEIKLSLFEDGMVAYIENPNESTESPRTNIGP